MTEEEQAFISAICHTPDDDAPRLVYADWLDEHGQSDFAEFIRKQIQLARMKTCLISDSNHTCPYHDLKQEITNLFNILKNPPIPQLDMRRFNIRTWLVLQNLINVYRHGECNVYRGFPHHLMTTRHMFAEENKQNIIAMFSQFPIRSVTLLDAIIRESYALGPISIYLPIHPHIHIDPKQLIGFQTELKAREALSTLLVNYGRELAGLPSLKFPT